MEELKIEDGVLYWCDSSIGLELLQLEQANLSIDRSIERGDDVLQFGHVGLHTNDEKCRGLLFLEYGYLLLLLIIGSVEGEDRVLQGGNVGLHVNHNRFRGLEPVLLKYQYFLLVLIDCGV